MEDKIINKSSLEKVQNETQKFAKKKGGKAPKILCGILAAATPALILLSACSGPETVKDNGDGTSITYRPNELMQEELDFEKNLATYLSKVTKIDVKFVDVKTLQQVDNKLILNGSMITDVTKGEETTSITLELSAEQIASLQEKLEPVFYYYISGSGKLNLSVLENSFSLNYKQGLVDNLSDIINSYQTSVVSMYNHETTSFEYPVEND